jgi:hypothetical protein
MRFNALSITISVGTVLLFCSCAPPTGQVGQAGGSAKTQNKATTRKGPKPSDDEHWLDTDRIEAAVDDQAKACSKDPQAFSKHVHDLYELQRCADVLMELDGGLRALATRVTNSLPNGVFPIADLPRYFPPGPSRPAVGLVVVVMHGPVPVLEGQPSRPQLLRRIDTILRRSGVKRRVHEAFDDARCFKLDSADLAD